MSKTLQAFYLAYWKWLCRGAKVGGMFTRDQGLCNNLTHYLVATTGFTPMKNGVSSSTFHKELEKQFEAAGHWPLQPFHDRSHDYLMDSQYSRHHTNARRILWVKEHLPSTT